MFRDRTDAGQKLAAKLNKFANRDDVLVLALPRGGVPVAFEVATRLNVPMDILVVRKLGVPGREELAFGAIASGEVTVLNHDLICDIHLSNEVIAQISSRERKELQRRQEAYRGGAESLALVGKTVILIDDGIATGASMHAAISALRQQSPSKVVIAVPTAPPSTCEELKTTADEIVTVIMPEPFIAVGEFYETFTQTSDEEVKRLFQSARQRHT